MRFISLTLGGDGLLYWVGLHGIIDPSTKGVIMFTLQLDGIVSEELPVEGFASPQELCNWIADGWDLEYPKVSTVQEGQDWLRAQGSQHIIVQL